MKTYPARLSLIKVVDAADLAFILVKTFEQNKRHLDCWKKLVLHEIKEAVQITYIYIMEVCIKCILVYRIRNNIL